MTPIEIAVSGASPIAPAPNDAPERDAGRAGLAVFLALLLLYAASLAPRVTFWDAGEFIAAIDSWGIPHPPGTPLYVTLGRAVHLLFAWLPTALAVNALSAACAAGACALGAALLTRSAVSAGAGAATAIGGGLCAGCMTSVWLSATEAEVYSASLLLSASMLMAADRAARAKLAGAASAAVKWRRLLVYLFALAAPLHASALVAGPAAIWLAGDTAGTWTDTARDARGAAWREAAVLALAFAGAAALATGHFIAAGIALAALAGVSIDRRSGARRAILPFALGATPLLILLLRARHDPALNQGNPAGWQALADVIGRRQYEVAGLFPRQAPPWIQVANFFQYADWQVALGLAPESTASVPRAMASLAFVSLGIIGARAHRARDRRTFHALLVLLASASLGVVVYLNLKAGPSIGWGILPDAAPHEARERDYFFALAFWTWGMWAGYGAVTFASRRAGPHHRRAGVIGGLAIAALPALVNWPVMNRRREPDASAASRLADALLASTPPNGVLVVWGDNDTYPLWEAQRARASRRDVTIVTSPLLGAGWYRDELRRRWAIDPGPLANERDMVTRAVSSARAAGRPVAISVTVPARVRNAAGTNWTRCGIAWTEGSAPCNFGDGASAEQFLRAHPPGRFTDNTVRSMLESLDCPRLASRDTADRGVADSLARACNTR